MKRSVTIPWPLCVVLLLAFVGTAFSARASDAEPSVLIILVDDCTFRDLPIYGAQNAKIPNIDRWLAAHQAGKRGQHLYFAKP